MSSAILYPGRLSLTPVSNSVSLNHLEDEGYYMWPGILSNANASDGTWGYRIQHVAIPRLSPSHTQTFTPRHAPATKASFGRNSVYTPLPASALVQGDHLWGLEAQAQYLADVDTTPNPMRLHYAPPNAPPPTKLTFPESQLIPPTVENDFTNHQYWLTKTKSKLKLIPVDVANQPRVLSYNPPLAPRPTQLHFDANAQKIVFTDSEDPSNNAHWGMGALAPEGKVRLRPLANLRVEVETDVQPTSLNTPMAPAATCLAFSPEATDLSDAKLNGAIKAELYSNERFWGMQVKAKDLVPRFFDTSKPLEGQSQADVDQLMMLLRQRYPLISAYGLEQYALEMLDKLLRERVIATARQ